MSDSSEQPGGAVRKIGKVGRYSYYVTIPGEINEEAWGQANGPPTLPFSLLLDIPAPAAYRRTSSLIRTCARSKRKSVRIGRGRAAVNRLPGLIMPL